MTGFKPPRGTRPRRSPRRRRYSVRPTRKYILSQLKSFRPNTSSQAKARQQWTRSLALSLGLIVCAYPAAVMAQKKKGDETDVPERERNVKKERSNMFKKWIDEDVASLITDEEKK